MESSIEAVSPLGIPVVDGQRLSPRLRSLEGKTIGETYNESFKGEFMFPVYRELLRERFPGVKIIPYTEFPVSLWKGTPAYQREKALEVARLAKERGCDVLISGNGG